MGRRGPRPLPTRILEMRGSWRANINRDEPTPPPGIPECPDWLSAPAKAMWEELVPMLVASRILSKLDRNALARYCHHWARWRQSEDFLTKYGLTYPVKDKRGNIRCFLPFPEVSIARQTALLLGKLEQELGLTPSARSRVVTIPPPPQEPGTRRFFNNPPRYVPFDQPAAG